MRRRKTLLRAVWLAINLLFGQDPPCRFRQVASDGHHGLLVILCAFDSLIETNDVSSCQTALINYDKIARFHV